MPPLVDSKRIRADEHIEKGCVKISACESLREVIERQHFGIHFNADGLKLLLNAQRKALLRRVSQQAGEANIAGWFPPFYMIVVPGTKCPSGARGVIVKYRQISVVGPVLGPDWSDGRNTVTLENVGDELVAVDRRVEFGSNSLVHELGPARVE